MTSSLGPSPAHRSRVPALLATALALVLGASLLGPGAPGSYAASPTSAAPAAAPAAPAAPAAARTADERAMDRVARPRVKWRSCSANGRVQCAQVRVPLDYDNPRGAKTTLAVTRSQATRPGLRMGSLFVNPGGPGGSAASFAPFAASLLGPRVRARFDVIGIDPRGVGGSGATTCRGELGSPALSFPQGVAQARVRIRTEDNLRRVCARSATRLVRHASTADVARDMELMRRVVGDRRLNYYGISYGSYLGATYAAMFPSRIRALAVDGVLDPIAWSNGGATPNIPFSARLRSGEGAAESLRAAFDECAAVGVARCPIAAGPDEAWARVLRAARAGVLVDSGFRVSYQDVVGLALSTLYSAESIPFLVQVIDELDDQLARRGRRGGTIEVGSAAYDKLVAARDALVDRGLYATPLLPTDDRPSAERARTADVLFNAVTCSDGRNPRDPWAWEREARRQDTGAGSWFGRLWTWASSPCARGGFNAAADSFRGPWRPTTSAPVLVVGNSHDPATPITGARRLQSLFAGSRLLQWNGWGHGALGTGSCVTAAWGRYFVDRQLPPEGTVCEPEQPLYPTT